MSTSIQGTAVRAGAIAVSILAATGVAAGSDIDVRITNTMTDGSFFLTPFWVAAHNGQFDSYDGGTFADAWPGLEDIAEEGNTGPLGGAFEASPAGQAGGMHTTIIAMMGGGDAPVFSPGESTSVSFDAGDAMVNQYFSFASMVIPSNDLFIANGDPFVHRIFDDNGDFIGPLTIEIRGGDANDAGTEVNDAFGGAAFSANGGTSQDERELIRNFFTMQGDEEYLESFVGTQTVTGDTIETTFGRGDLIARIEITPTPGALAAFAVAGIAARRRRRA